MAIVVDVTKSLAQSGIFEESVKHACAFAYAAIVHRRQDLKLSNLDEKKPLGPQIDALAGGQGAPNFSFNPHEVLEHKAASPLVAPSGGPVISTPELYDALARIHGWRDYIWADFDAEQTAEAWSSDETVSEFIERMAAKFNLDASDPITKFAQDREGMIGSDAYPSPRI